MASLKWDQTGEKKYESGVSKGVLYKKTTVGSGSSAVTKWLGTAWNGLTAVTESPEGAEKTDLYADNIKYASLRSAETFGGTIEAYTYPPEFASCNGEASLLSTVPGIVIGQQAREAFGLCYRTEQGTDENPNAGYKLHLVYNCTCSPSERAYETINDSPDAITLSWEFDSTPVNVTGAKATSILTIDSLAFNTDELKAKLAKIEAALYGVDADAEHSIEAADPYLPTPDEIATMMTATT